MVWIWKNMLDTFVHNIVPYHQHLLLLVRAGKSFGLAWRGKDKLPGSLRSACCLDSDELLLLFLILLFFFFSSYFLIFFFFLPFSPSPSTFKLGPYVCISIRVGYSKQKWNKWHTPMVWIAVHVLKHVYVYDYRNKLCF